MPYGTEMLKDQNLRRRKHKDGEKEKTIPPKERPHSNTRKPVPIRSGGRGFASLIFSVLLPLVLSYAVSIYCDSRLPQDRHENGSTLSPFNKTKAMRHIHKIAQKPRFVATTALEESLQYILAELQKLKVPAEDHGMELDVHMFRSEADSFSTSVGNVNLVNSYDDMRSIVARIRPGGSAYNTTEKSLLINAHVDSAIGAPGANDNAVAVGISMEVARSIVEGTHHDKPLKRPVIFLFNGGEEVVLPAAHSFVTQHPWAQTIVAHINMESIGSGDSYHLFRLGPGSPWLAEAYARSVSVPSGTVAGTDVFNSKIIPAETDFRIFDEVGNIPGFDFVLLDNGYVYHTTYDSIDKIDEVGVCHGGDMLYELTMELAGPNDAIGSHIGMVNPRSSKRWYDALRSLSLDMGLVRDRLNPRVAFFDVLHLKTIVYEEGVAALINIFVVAVSGMVWAVKIWGMNKKYVCDIVRMFLVMGASVAGGAASATFTSLIYVHILGAKLCWYGNWMVAVLVFGPPIAFGIVTALLMSLPRQLSVHRFDQMLIATSAVYALLSVCFTRYGVMSSYIPTSVLVVSSICAIQGSRVHAVARHALLMGVHAVLGAKLTATSFSSILPLLGRIKSAVVPHDTIAAIVVTFLLFAHGALSSLPILCYYCFHLRKLRTFLFVVSVGVAAGLMGVLPAVRGRSSQWTYSTDAPKRISAIHFYSPQQDPQSVLWLGSQDPVPMNQSRILSGLAFAETGTLGVTPTWGNLRSTALETFRPFEVFFQQTIIVRADSLPNLPIPTASVVKEEELSEGWNITVHVKGPESHLMTMRLQTDSRSVIKNWSINSEMSNHEDGVWVKHTGTSDFRFWLLLKKRTHAPNQRPNVTVAFSSGRLGFSRSPEVLKQLFFEEWEAPAVAVSTGVEVML